MSNKTILNYTAVTSTSLNFSVELAAPGGAPFRAVIGISAWNLPQLDATGKLNPSTYITPDLTPYALLAGAAFTGNVSINGAAVSFNVAGITATVDLHAALGGVTIPTPLTSDNSQAAVNSTWVRSQLFISVVSALFQFLGDGSDGPVVLDGTNVYTWATKVGNVYTLTRDVFPSSLKFVGNAQLFANCFRPWVQGDWDVSACTAPVHFYSYGASGSPGTIGGPGAVSTAVTWVAQSGTQVSNSTIGGAATPSGIAGASGQVAAGAQASIQTVLSFYWNNGGLAGASGAGGLGSGGAGGLGRAAAAMTNASNQRVFRSPSPDVIFFNSQTSSFALSYCQGGASGGGGGGGGGNGTNNGGSGGSGGSGGGCIWASCLRLVKGTATTSISVQGTPGGNGYTPITGTNIGGGGGGSGGGGGWIHFLYGSITGTGTFSLVASGGPGGNGGNGVGTGVNGSGGQGGASGYTQDWNFSTGVQTFTPYAAASAAPGVGVTPGGLPGVCVRVL